ncbi:MAG: nucleotidyltransferase family protein [bacterium]|nr:nucleotidyltransferase family protein [bacterium]
MKSYDWSEGWASKEQELLLRASLLQRKEALDAWQEWQSCVNIDDRDQGSERLLPLLYHNLRQQGVDSNSSVMWKLKGFYRLTWAKNQLLFRTMTTLLCTLHDAGFQTMLLKGTALTVLYYENYGLRPMADFDVLIPTEQATAAIELLPALGWHPAPRLPEKFTGHYVPIVHAHEFRDARDQPFDLHWHVLEKCCQTDADSDFWDGAVPVMVQGVSTLALNSTDQLLHACIHGFRWNPVPPMRWVADAMIVLKHSTTEIDWERLLNQARKRRLVIPVREALRYLSTIFEAPIPRNVLQKLQQQPASRVESVEYRYKRRNFHQKPLGYLVIMWFNYTRWTQRRGIFSHLLGFFDYIRRFWGLANFRQFPKYFGIMLVHRIREVFK